MPLLPFQLKGVDFLTSRDRRSKYLADDMGLGKTAQVIEACKRIGSQRHLVICPAAVKYGWAREIVQWGGGQTEEIQILQKKSDLISYKAKWVIVNYELLLADILHRSLKNASWDVLICDEAHYLKNPAARRTKKILSRFGLIHSAKTHFFLSGTPILNRPSEIYPILKVIGQDLINEFPDMISFGRYFCNGFKTHWAWDFSGASNLEELNERLKPLFLRRTKEEVLPELPDVFYQMVPCSETIIPGNCDDETPLATLRREIGIAKILAVHSYVKEILDQTDKLVIFAHHREVIDTLAASLKDYGVVILYGGMSTEAKQKSVDAFVIQPNTRVFIGQLQAAGQGIDGLQKVCSRVVFAEFDWSPGVMDQALDRCRRIGQKDTVWAQYLYIPGSIEESMIRILEKKRTVINTIVDFNVEDKDTFTMTIESELKSIAVAAEKLVTLLESIAAVDLKVLAVKLNEQPELNPLDPGFAIPVSTKAKEQDTEVTTESKRGRQKKTEVRMGDLPYQEPVKTPSPDVTVPPVLQVPTHDQLMAVVQEYLGDPGDPIFVAKKERVAILRDSLTGVNALKDVPEDKRAVLIEALKEELQIRPAQTEL